MIFAATLAFGILARHRSLLLLASISGVLFTWVPAPPTELLILAGLAYAAISGGRPAGIVWLRPRLPPMSFVSAILLGLVSALFLLAWFAWWSPRQPHIHVSDLGAWTPPVIGVALFLALLNAVAEEVFWRAFVGAAMLEAATFRSPAILGQSLGFGLMHLYGFPGGWLGVTATTVFGIAAMILTLRSRSIWPAVIAHGIADTTILIQILAQ